MTEFKKTFRITVQGGRPGDLAAPLQVLLVLFGGAALAWVVSKTPTPAERWLVIICGVGALLIGLNALQNWKKSGSLKSALESLEQSALPVKITGGIGSETAPGVTTTTSEIAPGVTTKTTTFKKTFKFTPIDLEGQDPKQMLTDLESWVEHNPQDPEAWLKLGQLHAQLGSGKEAGEAMVKYLSISGQLEINLSKTEEKPEKPSGF